VLTSVQSAVPRIVAFSITPDGGLTQIDSKTASTEHDKKVNGLAQAMDRVSTVEGDAKAAEGLLYGIANLRKRAGFEDSG
jgi:hypothetical protein